MAFKLKTHIRRSENCCFNYGKCLHVSPCDKNEWISSDTGGCFYNRGNITLLHLTGNCNCLHLKNGYPPDPMQVVAFLFSFNFEENRSILSYKSNNLKIRENKILQGKRHIA